MRVPRPGRLPGTFDGLETPSTDTLLERDRPRRWLGIWKQLQYPAQEHMTPDQLFANPYWDKQTAHAIRCAFELAWSRIAIGFSPGAETVRARQKLASAMLAVAAYHGTGVSMLSEGAIERMRYRDAISEEE